MKEALPPCTGEGRVGRKNDVERDWQKVILGLKSADIPKVVFFVILCQLAGGIGSYFTRPAIPTWYATLQKPLLTPPDWVFAPVWITLYALMGISVFLVWRERRYGKETVFRKSVV